jgi:hypothetical protein
MEPSFKSKERLSVTIGQVTKVSIPYPSTWNLHASVGGRPLTSGTLHITAVVNNKISGAVNYRGTLIPIQGYWNENTKQITFDSPYASYVGNLTIFDEPQIAVRHYVLRGSLIMKPPSLRAGERGTWVATTDIRLTGQM